LRYFAHDGKTVHGPAVLDELLQLPGFDGDTLVCPVGSENSADWKPALAYPSFREALLAPAPKPPPPAPAAPPPPAPAPSPTLPCPRCARPNPIDARYCNACAARMDGFVEPAPVPLAPLAAEPAAALTPLEPAPFEPPAPEAAAEPAADPAPAAAPEPAPSAAATWRKPLVASFAGAALASAVLGWWLLRPVKRAAPAVAVLDMPAAPAAAPAVATPIPPPVLPPAPAAPAAAAAAPAAAAAAPARPSKTPAVDLNELTQAPAKPAIKKPRRRSHVPKRRPPVPPPAPAAAKAAGPADDETLIESHTSANEPAIPGGAPAGDAPPADAATAQEDRGFLLPGVPRRVPPSATKPKPGAASAPTPSAAAGSPAADAAAAAAPEDPTTKQVREQFVFCAQLLSQGAFADHFDTCLCSDARSAAPYRNRRGFYASSLKKAAAAGTLATSAEVKSIVLDGPIAKVTADWKSGASEKPRTETENWQLEDGLWCRYP